MRLTEVMKRVDSVAIITSGIGIYGPTLLSLLQHPAVPVTAWVVAVTSFLLWVGAFLARGVARSVRGTIQGVAGLYLLWGAYVTSGAPQVGPAPAETWWIPLSTVTFAIVLGAVFSFDLKNGAVAAVVVTTIDAIMVTSAPPSAVYYSPIPPGIFIGPLLDITAGVGLAVTRHMWYLRAHQVDAQQSQLLGLAEREQREVEVWLSQASLERRLHETILNTLSALATGVPDPEQARAACAKDVALLDREFEQLPRCDVLTALQAARSGLAFPVPVDVTAHTNPELSAPAANALRSAAYRLFASHDVSDPIVVTVTNEDERLLVQVTCATPDTDRQTVQREVAGELGAVAASVRMSDARGDLTAFMITVPTTAPLPEVPPQFPVLDFLIHDSLYARLGLLGANVFLFLSAFSLVYGFALWELELAVVMAFCVVNVVMALTWRTPWRVVLASTALALGLAAFLIPAATSGLPCTQENAATWLITGLSGGGSILILLAFHRTATRVPALLLLFAASLYLAFNLPPTCRGDAVASAFTNLAYLAGVVYVVTWIGGKVDVSRRQSLMLWQRIVADRALSDRQETMAAGWRAYGAGARVLLAGVADGSLDPQDPVVRQQAAAEAAAIRSQMALGSVTVGTTTMGQLARSLQRAAAHAGATVIDDVVVPVSRTDPLPEQVLAMLHRAVSSDAGEVRLYTVVDEDFEDICLRGSSRMFVSAGFEDGDYVFGDTVVTISTAVDAHDGRVRVRRPAV